jgi:hypothetical protein
VSAIEVWKDVVGYEGKYKVSSYGNVIGPRGKVLKPTTNLRGYSQVSLYDKDSGMKVFNVQLLVITAFVGPRPEGMYICHNDDVKTNNNLSNLRYDTPSSNVLDSYTNNLNRKKSSGRFGKGNNKCLRGHVFVPETVIIMSSGRRACRACNYARQQIRYEEKALKPVNSDMNKLADAKYNKILERTK